MKAWWLRRDKAEVILISFPSVERNAATKMDFFFFFWTEASRTINPHLTALSLTFTAVVKTQPLNNFLDDHPSVT